MVGPDLGLSLYPIVVDIYRLVKDTAVAFCKARKLVNEKCKEVDKRKYEANRWLHEADDMIETSPPSSIPRLQDYRDKLDEALGAYESDVNGWHKAINLETPEGTVHGCAGRTRQVCFRCCMSVVQIIVVNRNIIRGSPLRAAPNMLL